MTLLTLLCRPQNATKCIAKNTNGDGIYTSCDQCSGNPTNGELKLADGTSCARA